MSNCSKKWIHPALLCIAMTVHVYTRAQTGIGIGTNSPNASAALDITFTAQPKGLLIPRVTTVQRTSLGNTTTSSANGLMVFDTDINKFCFFLGTGWYIINTTTQTAPALSTDPLGTINVSQALATTSTINATGDITTSGTISAQNYAMNLVGNGPIPQGGIIMWSGSVVPDGWKLCDGTDNTPNLSGRFIVASGQSNYAQAGDLNPNYIVGGYGGWNNYQLTASDIPPHSHSISGGSHNHTVTGQQGGDNSDHSNTTALAYGDKGATETGFNSSYSTSTSSSHLHTISSEYGNGGGVANAHENRPAYYVLAFIMKK